MFYYCFIETAIKSEEPNLSEMPKDDALPVQINIKKAGIPFGIQACI
jgi:hypothetical protein